MSTDNLQHGDPGREQCLQVLLLQPPAPSANLPTLHFRGSGEVMTRTPSLWYLASWQEDGKGHKMTRWLQLQLHLPVITCLTYLWRGDGKRHYPEWYLPPVKVMARDTILSDTRTLLWRNGCAHPCSSRSCTHMRTEEGRLEWGRICKIAHRGPQTQLKRPQEPGLERSCDWIEFLWILAWRPFGTRGRLPSWRPDHVEMFYFYSNPHQITTV